MLCMFITLCGICHGKDLAENSGIFTSVFGEYNKFTSTNGITKSGVIVGRVGASDVRGYIAVFAALLSLKVTAVAAILGCR